MSAALVKKSLALFSDDSFNKSKNNSTVSTTTADTSSGCRQHVDNINNNNNQHVNENNTASSNNIVSGAHRSNSKATRPSGASSASRRSGGKLSLVELYGERRRRQRDCTEQAAQLLRRLSEAPVDQQLVDQLADFSTSSGPDSWARQQIERRAAVERWRLQRRGLAKSCFSDKQFEQFEREHFLGAAVRRA